VRERFPRSADAAGILDIILYQRPPRIDFFCPVRLRRARQLLDAEGDPWAIEAESLKLWWLTGLDPQEKLAGLVASLVGASGHELGTFSVELQDGYWRGYEPVSGGAERFLLLMARSRRTMAGVVRRDGHALRIRGPGMAVLRWESGGPVAVLGEELDLLELDGTPLAWKRIEPGPRVERKRWSLPARPLESSLNRD
jgi:hypothetical protein